ncbi:putative membrane protein [Colletotrichum chlorophyti]|uniref:Putative membrane protein n=1 Tax=Colletotrichum chlorophyti TaxID=708187 RepID=A0A1Q8S375_9PEZI|nr:putative membrane protein [Colletotrichum chlorophyti]
MAGSDESATTITNNLSPTTAATTNAVAAASADQDAAQKVPDGTQAPDVAAQQQNPAAAMTTAEKPEYDDFGLPIRRYVPPPSPPAEETDHTTKPQSEPQQLETESLRDQGNKGEADEPVPDDKNKPSGKYADSESEEDEFKDAQSEQPVATAVSETNSKTSATPVTPNLDQDSIKDGEETSTNKDEMVTTNGRGKEEKEGQTQEPLTSAEPKTEESSSSESPNTDKDGAQGEVEVTANGIENQADAKKPEQTAPAKSNGERPESPARLVDKADEPEPKSAGPTSPTSRHVRDTSITSNTGMSEFSHQQLTSDKKEEEEDDDGEWQTMPAYAPYDIYDEDNKLVAKEFKEEEDEKEKYGYGGLGGAGKGYTRVIMDDDAESATSMDENTQYLFKDVKGTSMTEDDSDTRDAVSQMQATKDLLTEGQRIAYVGLTRLEIHNLVKEAEAIEHTRQTKKEVNMSAEATKMWGQKMMIRLYAHMDISSAEQVMVEQLSDHGVVPSDLTPLLMANARVKNPMAEESRSSVSLSSPKSLPPSSPALSEHEKAAEAPPPYDTHEGEELPPVKTPAQLTTADKIDIDLRWTVLCDLFLILIADSLYDCRSRILLERVGKSLQIDWLEVRKFEKKVTDALEMQQAAEKENWNEDEHMETRRKQALKKRYVMMGLATVGGGLVIGLSAGLLAPVIGAGLAAGFTTIGVTGTSTFLGGVGGAAIITSSAAASGSVIGVRAANRRTGAVKTFEYRPLHNNKRVHLVVTVAGWMTGKVDDVRLPFSTVDPIMGDLYSVYWEPEMLRSMGDTINILATEALTQGLQQVLGSTILTSLMAALTLPVVLTKLAYLIDNPWSVSQDRAWAAGLILADSLIDRSLGTRPVTLVGYSLGSRVIFSCLLELARKGAYGLVQNVYLFGSPLIVKKDEWLRARTVVPGRFVNGYSTNDWILAYLFRLTSGGPRKVAGLAPIQGLPWIENFDVTEFVKGHMEYRVRMPRLLRECGWLVESDEFSEIEDPDPENHQERQRELINEIEEARKELEKEGQKKKSRFSIFGRGKKTEKEKWEIYETTAKEGNQQSTSRTEDKEGNNHGVLFDVEAIRAELAKDKNKADEEPADFQVKELQSTLPPMKLDLSSSTSSLNPRDSLRETKSAYAVPGRTSSGSYSYTPERTPTFQSSQTFSSTQRATSPYHAAALSPHDDEIQMTFEDSFQDPPPAPRPPPKDEPASTRPEIKSAQTVPNISLADPWADDDDDDFGKEKEISMTFA